MVEQCLQEDDKSGLIIRRRLRAKISSKYKQTILDSPADGIMNEFAAFILLIVLIISEIQFPFAIKHCQSSNNVIFQAISSYHFFVSIQFLPPHLVRVVIK